jgi:calcium-dependent protein kinase
MMFGMPGACLQVIAENLSEDEIAGLKEMFKMIDADNSGQITFEELKVGLKKVGANLQESEIYALMQAVSDDRSTSVRVFFFLKSHRTAC